MIRIRTRLVAALTLVVAAAPAVSRADLVTDWNDLLLTVIRSTATNPPRATRAIAMMNTAIYDSVNAINGNYEVYRVDITPPNGSSAEAAVAAAARRVLIHLYPAQTSTFDDAFNQDMLGIPDGSGKTDGVALGEYVADRIIEWRSTDGANVVVPYTPATGPGEWQPTPPAMAPALLPNWPYVTCWGMINGQQFRGSGPPDLTSAAYTKAFNDVKTLGAKTGSTRTADQSQIAQFWADGGGTETPPGHWIAIAVDIAKARGNTLDENARLFALLSICLADAAICSWDNKYAFDDWRPITGIRNADTDGNPNTTADPAWESFITTPPFPSYTSGHSTFSGSASRALALFFGTDEISFTTDSDGLPGVTRSFTKLSDAASEAADSRLYGGIHWYYDNDDGLAAGLLIATFVYENYLGKVRSRRSRHDFDFSADLCGGLSAFAMASAFAGLAGLRLSNRRIRRREV